MPAKARKAPKNAFATVLTAGLGPLLSSGKYSDLTVHCEDNAWKVHRIVMCAHSKFFAKACDGGFMVVKCFYYLSIVTIQDATMLRSDHLMGSAIKQLSSLAISCSFQGILTFSLCRRRNLARSNLQVTSRWS